jgi:threonine dehydratase
MSATPGALTFRIARELIGQGFTVTDDEVARAVRYAFEELKLVVEPGGVVGLAALLAGKLDVTGKVVVGVLSGANVDVEQFAKLITRD